MANPELVAKSATSDSRGLLQNKKHTQTPLSSSQARNQTPTEEIESRTFSSIWTALKERGVPRRGRQLILKSWRNSTKQQYHCYVSKWIKFCDQRINPFQPSINQVLKFLSRLFHNGLQYRTIGLAKSAVCVFVKLCSNTDFSKCEEMTQFMRGAFIERPALPKYNITWDVNIVLSYISRVDATTLLQLSCKLCMLFLLLTAQRCQTLHLIELNDIKFSENSVTILPNHILKQTRPGQHLDVIQLKVYTKDKSLCIVQTLLEYISRTETIRKSDKLLISTLKPYKHVSKSTVSRWVKLTMQNAGIDQGFKPHSTRSASTSKAKFHGVPLEKIVKTAGWSNAAVFGKYYNKSIKNDRNSFQDAILGNA